MIDSISNELRRIAKAVAAFDDRGLARKAVPQLRHLDKNGIDWDCTISEDGYGSGSSRIWWYRYNIILPKYDIILVIRVGSTQDDKIVYGKDMVLKDNSGRKKGGFGVRNITQLIAGTIDYCKKVDRGEIV